ncbi:hypothetical protein EYF80_008348 [Liparis tanakae]|uniref:Uncharacterized protein n=1 Tax=Liparis tanakae TaxID=230148 RepID=A0A4Z2IUP7_9TELE|nr:hypothetical protein EYF80_008348 [Liparis tanakae]
MHKTPSAEDGSTTARDGMWSRGLETIFFSLVRRLPSSSASTFSDALLPLPWGSHGKDAGEAYQTSLSGFPLGLRQQLLYTLQRVLQDVHLEQQSLSLDLHPTQLLHHLFIAGLQLKLHHKHIYKSVWAHLEEGMSIIRLFTMPARLSLRVSRLEELSV